MWCSSMAVALLRLARRLWLWTGVLDIPVRPGPSPGRATPERTCVGQNRRPEQLEYGQLGRTRAAQRKPAQKTICCYKLIPNTLPLSGILGTDSARTNRPGQRRWASCLTGSFDEWGMHALCSEVLQKFSSPNLPSDTWGVA